MRVAVRVRPLLSFEKTERLGECLSCIPQSKQLCVGDGGDNGRNTFTFDFTFPKACEQRSLYDDCVASLLEGGVGDGLTLRHALDGWMDVRIDQLLFAVG